MQIQISSIKIEQTTQTKNKEPIYSAIVELFAPICGAFVAIYPFTQSGLFLLKHGHPFVKFRNFDKSCDHEYSLGQTNYQKLLYNRVIERLGDIKTQITSYLLSQGYIDSQALQRRDPSLYNTAIQLKELSFK